MALELVSYTDLANLIDLTKGLLSDYPALSIIMDSMVSAFEEFTGRKLEKIARTDTQFVGALKRSQIKLPAIPIESVASVTVTVSGISESYTEDDDYDITNYGIRLWTACQNCKIVVVYTGGLAAVTEEANLNRAALYQVGYEWQNKTHIGAETVSTEGGSVTRPELQLLKEVKRMLKP